MHLPINVKSPNNISKWQMGFNSAFKGLMVYERKVLRRIFGPTKERDGTWRIKTNDKLNELIRHTNVINYIKSQILSRFGHLH
jgi:hypothetical protein